MLFVEQKEFVWGLIASMYLGNVVGLLIVLTCVPLLAAILRIPFSIIAPIILVFCAIGAYTVHNSTFDVMLMMVFGVFGYLLKKCNYPLAPMVLAIVLGDKAEESFRQSLLASQGSLTIFWSNWLVGHDYGTGPDRPVLDADLDRSQPVTRATGCHLIWAAGAGGQNQLPGARFAWCLEQWNNVCQKLPVELPERA